MGETWLIKLRLRRIAHQRQGATFRQWSGWCASTSVIGKRPLGWSLPVGHFNGSHPREDGIHQEFWVPKSKQFTTGMVKTSGTLGRDVRIKKPWRKFTNLLQGQSHQQQVESNKEIWLRTQLNQNSWPTKWMYLPVCCAKQCAVRASYIHPIESCLESWVCFIARWFSALEHARYR